MEVADRLGKCSTLTCPECGGTLWQIHDASMLRYRCHLGHALTAEHLSADQGDAIENALWVALKTLEESGALALQMASRAEKIGDKFNQRLFQARAMEAVGHAAKIREILAHSLPSQGNT